MMQSMPPGGAGPMPAGGAGGPPPMGAGKPAPDQVKQQLIQLVMKARQMAEANGVKWEEILAAVSGGGGAGPTAPKPPAPPAP